MIIIARYIISILVLIYGGYASMNAFKLGEYMSMTMMVFITLYISISYIYFNIVEYKNNKKDANNVE